MCLCVLLLLGFIWLLFACCLCLLFFVYCVCMCLHIVAHVLSILRVFCSVYVCCCFCLIRFLSFCFSWFVFFGVLLFCLFLHVLLAFLLFVWCVCVSMFIFLFVFMCACVCVCIFLVVSVCVCACFYRCCVYISFVCMLLPLLLQLYCTFLYFMHFCSKNKLFRNSREKRFGRGPGGNMRNETFTCMFRHYLNLGGILLSVIKPRPCMAFLRYKRTKVFVLHLFAFFLHLFAHCCPSFCIYSARLFMCFLHFLLCFSGIPEKAFWECPGSENAQRHI